ncbi:hypothetical protein [Novosphingobium panipatense]|uniref:hypothetical protein n=1 Tax=Novosphingobium panipatense TaxID=428991 RepID=UPI00361FA0D5
MRAIATSISPDLHVEKVKVLVSEPTTEQHAVLGEDLDELIGEGSSDLGLAAAIEADLERFMVLAKSALGESEDGELRLLAAQGDWAGILGTASTALRSRLTPEA